MRETVKEIVEEEYEDASHDKKKRRHREPEDQEPEKKKKVHSQLQLAVHHFTHAVLGDHITHAMCGALGFNTSKKPKH